MLHLEISKALCGMMVSSLLFYRKLRKDLEELGFKVNPYDIVWQTKWSTDWGVPNGVQTVA